MGVDDGSDSPLWPTSGRGRTWLVAVLVAVGLLIGGGLLTAPDPPAMVPYPVRWHLTDGQTPTARSTSVDVEVDDNGCADGIPASQRLRPAKIVYDEQTVTVALTAELADGFHTCPMPIGPGIHTVTIRLDEPLGDRTLLDGNARAGRDWCLDPVVGTTPGCTTLVPETTPR